MKLLENIFLGLTILIPIAFIVLMMLNLQKVKKSKKVRFNFIKMIFISFIVFGSLFGGIKLYNNKNESNLKQIEKNTNNKNNNNNTTGKKDDVPNEPSKPSQPEEKKTSKGFKIENRNGVTYIDNHLIVNKTYPLPKDYIPMDTHKKVESENCQECIINEAYNAYTKMKNDAKQEGLTLWIASGYRSYIYQNGLYSNYVKRSGKEAADTYSARAGHSEHQSGYAFDLNSVTDAFANTKEGKWVNENCYRYGFIIRYPKGKEDETGYKYESWHLRYVGIDLATKLYNAGDWITLEDYFGITSTYQTT